MKPIAITLEGFIGIRSGMGKDSVTLDLTSIPDEAQLVAIVGPNGGAKTTILDNLHPYRVMPSHNPSAGIGKFSYWDHIYGPTAKKELFWEHDGRHYQSLMSFRASGKSRTADYYLLEWVAENNFKPVVLPDGTTSNGSATTYDQCVEAIIGPPETFFMSMFSAQSKKPLAAYQATEIKSLLAAILEQTDLRTLSEKANLVGKLLKLELDKLQDSLAQARAATNQIAEATIALARLDADLVQKQALEVSRGQALEAARKALTVLETKRDAIAQDLEQRKFLSEQIEKARAQAQSERDRITTESDAEVERLRVENRRAEQELSVAQVAKQKLDDEIQRLHETLAKKPAIDQACKDLPMYQARIGELDAEMRAAETKLATLRPVKEAMQSDNEELARLKTSGTSKAEIIETLRVTAQLIDQVPCHGQDIQQTCPLLKNAMSAQVGVTQQEVALGSLRQKYREILIRVTDASTKIGEMPALEEAIKRITTERNKLGDLCQTASKLVGMAPMVEDAGKRIESLSSDRRVLVEREADFVARSKQYKQQIAGVLEQKALKTAAVERKLDTEVRALEEQLAKLAQPVSQKEMDDACKAVQDAVTALDEARAEISACREQRNELNGKILVLTNLQRQSAADVKLAETLSDELAKYKLIEKGLGTNGLIALMIDDAGPEISAICNDLLEECYDGRFAVRLETQRETGDSVRETFDVIVTDTYRGEDKSLRFMSGGEKVWVNECLLRAIALYVGQSSGIQHHTLFSDEADGALDEARKRQFMQMKRAVLKRGGYQREYYISHTPELWEMADYVIDVRKL